MRSGINIAVTASDRTRLEELVAARGSRQKHVWAARIVLLSDDGLGTVAIMAATGKSKTCVWRWQERFMAEGVDGLLRDKTRPPGIAPLKTTLVDKVVALTLEPPAHEATHWTVRAMAKAVGIAASSVVKIWHDHGHPRRRRGRTAARQGRPRHPRQLRDPQAAQRPRVNAARAAGVAVPNLLLVPEERVWSYGAGLKGTLGIVSGSLGVYYPRYDGFQMSVVGADGVARTQSAGTASNLGFEAEVNVRPARWIGVFGNAGYIDGGIDRDNSFAPAFSGARFRLQPEWQAAAGLTLDVPLGRGLRAFATPSVTYRSRIFFELPNSDAISQDKVTLVNARAGLSVGDGRYEIAGFVRNATDRDYLLDAGNTGGGFGIPTFIPAEPRFYGVQLTARY